MNFYLLHFAALIIVILLTASISEADYFNIQPLIDAIYQLPDYIITRDDNHGGMNWGEHGFGRATKVLSDGNLIE
jgi:hypothetical protein